MSNLSQFFGAGALKPRSIVNAFSSGGTYTQLSNINAGAIPSAVPSFLSGAVTANTLKTALSIIGRGAISLLGLTTKDTTSRSIRLKLTLDGVVVFDSTYTAVNAADSTMYAVGLCLSGGTPALVNEMPLFFDSSCLAEFSSSITETDKQALTYIYYTR